MDAVLEIRDGSRQHQQRTGEDRGITRPCLSERHVRGVATNMREPTWRADLDHHPSLARSMNTIKAITPSLAPGR